MKKLLRQTILYGCIGALSAGLDTLVFVGLWGGLHWSRYLANAVGVHCGILCSFLLNRRITFQMMDRPARRFLMFYGTGLAGLLVSQGLLWLGAWLWEDVLPVKLFSVAAVAALQFLLNRTLAFGRPAERLS